MSRVVTRILVGRASFWGPLHGIRFALHCGKDVRNGRPAGGREGGGGVGGGEAQGRDVTCVRGRLNGTACEPSRAPAPRPLPRLRPAQ